MYQLIKSVIDELSLDLKNVVGFSFDGAANMRSSNIGVNAFIKEDSPNSLYTWCHSHRLNLAVNDSCGSSIDAKLVEGLIQDTANFIKDSYKRMDFWTKTVQKIKNYPGNKRPQLSGSTRWWSREKSLSHILNDPLDFFVLLKVLQGILNDPSFDSKTLSGAKRLITSWCNYKTVLSALLLKKLFSILKIPTNYLQTRGLDMFQAISIIKISYNQINSFRKEYTNFKTESDQFIEEVNVLLQNDDELKQILVETTFKTKTIHKVKRRDGEITADESVNEPSKKFQTEVFNVLTDQLTSRINERFLNKDITNVMKEISSIHPCNYRKINDKQSFSELCKLSGIKNQQKLKMELKSFSQFYLSLKLNSNEEISEAIEDLNSTNTDTDSSDPDDSHIESEKETESADGEPDYFESVENNPSCTGKCLNCLGCVLKILQNYYTHSKAYKRLFKLYKAILILPCTQVECERSFSKLKFIKSKLRSSIMQENLEPLMILYCEKEMMKALPNEEIIDNFGKTSDLLTKLLI